MLKYLVRFLRRIGVVIVDYRTLIADIDERLPDNQLPPLGKMHYLNMGVEEVFKQSYDQIKDHYAKQSTIALASVEAAIASTDSGDVFRVTTAVTGVHEIVRMIHGTYKWNPCPLNDLFNKSCSYYSDTGWIGSNTDASDYIWLKHYISVFPTSSAYMHYISVPTLGTDLDSTVDVPDDFLPTVIAYAVSFLTGGEKEIGMARLLAKEGVNSAKDEVQ